MPKRSTRSTRSSLKRRKTAPFSGADQEGDKESTEFEPATPPICELEKIVAHTQEGGVVKYHAKFKGHALCGDDWFERDFFSQDEAFIKYERERQGAAEATPPTEENIKMWKGYVHLSPGDVVFAKTKGYWFCPARLGAFDQAKGEWKVHHFARFNSPTSKAQFLQMHPIRSHTLQVVCRATSAGRTCLCFGMRQKLGF